MVERLRAAHAVLRLAERHGNARLEAACTRALAHASPLLPHGETSILLHLERKPLRGASGNRALQAGIMACRRALSIDDNLLDALNNLGIPLKRLGRYGGVIDCFEKAQSLTIAWRWSSGSSAGFADTQTTASSIAVRTSGQRHLPSTPFDNIDDIGLRRFKSDFDSAPALPVSTFVIVLANYSSCGQQGVQAHLWHSSRGEQGTFAAHTPTGV